MKGNPDTPTGESWGGSFTRIDRNSRTIFEGNSTTADTVATYAVLEWRFKGPTLDIPPDSACFTFNIAGTIVAGLLPRQGSIWRKVLPQAGRNGYLHHGQRYTGVERADRPLRERSPLAGKTRPGRLQTRKPLVRRPPRARPFPRPATGSQNHSPLPRGVPDGLGEAVGVAEMRWGLVLKVIPGFVG